MLVYRIVNIITNKVYIGSTKNFTQRKKTHIESLYENRHHNKYLQADFNKYGIKTFKFEVLKRFLRYEHMITYEYQLINMTRNRYNIQTEDYTLIENKNKSKTKVLVQKNRVLIKCENPNKKSGQKKEKLGYFEAIEKVKNNEPIPKHKKSNTNKTKSSNKGSQGYKIRNKISKYVKF